MTISHFPGLRILLVLVISYLFADLFGFYGIAFYTFLLIILLFFKRINFKNALVIYLILHFHLQLRQFPLWQQALSLMSLILLVHIVTVVMTTKVTGWHAWLPAIVSTVLCPFIHIFLRGVRRTFHVR